MDKRRSHPMSDRPQTPPAPPPNPLFDEPREPGDDSDELAAAPRQPLPISHPDAVPPPEPAPTKALAPVAPAPAKPSSSIIAPAQTAKTAIARQTMEGQELEVQSESASIAAQAKALVAARFMMAERRPRDVDEARIRILRECERPGFAEVAEYSKPQGDRSVTGPSIRFAETALRLWGNVSIDVVQVYDDDEKRTIRAIICDLETNFTITKDQVFSKTVERKNPRKGQEVVGERVNTKGELVYLVRATEDESLTKENAFASKVIRTQGLRVIPGDIIAEAIAKCRETRRNRAAHDPDGERKRIADSFADLNVMPSDLKDYLGCDLAQASPAQMDELRAVYVGIKEGDLTFREALEEKAGKVAEEAAAPKAGGKMDALKAKLAAKKAGNGGA